ncbi:MAG TPA: hypothetical protein VFK94_04215 [Patescibacteria group bacterium]|nr:hypothetical protein [Patescibacteria group bacterium]
MSLDQAIKDWNRATADLPWGVQSVFKTALQSVADGDIKMVHGADSSNGSPCLVNAVNAMVSATASASPSAFAPAVVGAFDYVCREFYAQMGAPNADATYVTPFVAEVLLRNFGKDDPKPSDEELALKSVTTEPASILDDPYVEPSDEELMQAWLTAQTTPCTTDPSTPTEANDLMDAVLEGFKNNEHSV